MTGFHILTAAAVTALALLPVTGSAQDMNTLGRHLDHQQQQRVQDHQNRMRSAPPGRRGEALVPERQCSADALPPQERARIEARYREIARRQGRDAAQVYVREQGRLFGERLIAEGICTADGQTADQAQISNARRGDDADDGCRMVMAPVAGLGGGAMTMGMVRACD